MTNVGDMVKIRDHTISKSMGSLTFKRCTKFNPFYKGLPDNKNAVVFLKLRNDGCEKKDALNFCRRVVCRFDNTRNTDGPVSHRSLKVKEQKNAVTLNGWGFTSPTYEMERRFYSSVNEFIKTDDMDRLLANHFESHEKKIRGDYKRKIQALSEYYNNLHDLCNFTGLTRESLVKKIKEKRSLFNAQGVSLTPTFSSHDRAKSDVLDKLGINRDYDQRELIERKLLEELEEKLKPNDGSAPLKTDREHASRRLQRIMSIPMIAFEKLATENVIPMAVLKRAKTKLKIEEVEEVVEKPEEVIERSYKEEDIVEKKEMLDELAKQTNILTMLNQQSETNPLTTETTSKKKIPRKSFLEMAIKNTTLLADEFNQGNYIYFSKDLEKKEAPPIAEILQKKNSMPTISLTREKMATPKKRVKPLVSIEKLTYTIDKFLDTEETTARIDSTNLMNLMKYQREKQDKFAKRIAPTPTTISTSRPTRAGSFRVSTSSFRAMSTSPIN